MSGLVVTDLKQWVYCRRIVFYRLVMPGVGKPTYKMEEAKRAQEMVEGLEMRRTLSKYGFENANRRFGVWLSDEGAGLSGKVDLLVEDGWRGVVVDFKLTAGDPGENHRMQLAGYAWLVERALGLAVRQGFLYRIPDGRVFEQAIGREETERVERAVREMRRCREEEDLPAATEVRGRCVECEYQNYCGDVW